VRGFIVVQHEVERICGGGEKDDLEDGVPSRICKGPEEICMGLVFEALG